jgi:transposase
MFIPLTHAPGEAQADFGEALVMIAGVELKAHYLAMDLPHSDDCFVAAFPAETTEAFLKGHVRAFAYFGGVPTRILYDNSKIAVARILGGEERQRTRAFSELQSYYLFADKFGRPAKGNDKGKVEGLVGYARRNFMVPIPRVSSWEELNTRLEAESRKRRLRRLAGTQRPSESASSATIERCCRCRRRLTKPAKRSRAAPAHCHSFGIDRTTTPCPRSTDIARYG